ncbi:MAG: trypsin-like peptidase domain-containing protein [Acidobacteriaceae bacterium]|nr:trypsin-like peptidase domain-containing protein [Acidobacteriaceae bacterium]
MLRARNVARIEDDDGRPLGTGFLIHVPDFGGPENVLLITPSHVVSGEGAVPGSLDPSYVVVNFTLLGAKFRCSGVVASSPAHELDYTLLKLEKSAAKIQAYQPASALPAPDSGAKIYLVGHHGGRDLEITGDRLLDYDDRVLHYRAATAAGSSGSPVFNERWQLVGMHHAGRADMPKLHGAGTYQAKEGIRIKPILSSIQSQLPSPMPTDA